MSAYHSLSPILDGLGPEPLWHMTHFGQYSRDIVWKTLVGPERIHTILKTLSKKDAQALLQFLVQDPNGYNQIPSLQRHEQLVETLSKNLIMYTVNDGYVHAVVPLDFYPAILDALLIDRPQALISSVKTPRPEPTNGFEALLPLFHILSQARREPLPMTTNGQIYRRILTKMKKILPPSITPETLDRTARLGYYYHLLQNGSGRTLEASIDIEHFFSRGMGEVLSRFLQYGLDHGSPFQMITLALAALLGPEEWLDMNQFLKWGKDHRIPGAYDPYSLSYFLDYFVTLGIWEKRDKILGRLTDPYYYGWIWSELEPLSDQTLVIEPTGDVLVPPDTSLSTLWDIDGMAEIKKYDQMRVYHISRRSVTASVLDGWDADTFILRLQNMARVPIPGNLEHNIRDWFRQLTRHSVIHATILHSATTEDSINAERVLKPHIIKRLSPTELIIQGKEIKPIAQALEKYGIPLIPIVHDLDPSPRLAAPSPYEYDDMNDEGSRRTTVQQGNPLGLSRRLRLLMAAKQPLVVHYRKQKNKSSVETIRLQPIHIDPVFMDGVTGDNRVLTLYLDQIESYEVDGS